MNRKRTIERAHVLCLTVFVLAWLTVWGGMGVSSAQVTKVRVAYPTLGAVVLPVWTSKEAGLDRKHGVDAELILLRGGTPTIQGLLSKSFEFAILSGTSTTLANLGGADLVVVGTYHNRLNFKIIVRPEITGPKDLIGKKMGIQTFTGASVFSARVGLHNLGLNPGDVQLVAMGDNAGILAGMESKALASGSISDPHGLIAQKLGFKLLLDFGKSDLPFTNMSVIATREYVTSHEEVVTRYLKAVMEGIRHLLTYPDMAKKTLSKYARIKDPEVLDYTYRLFTPNFIPSLVLDPAGMKTVYDGLAEQRPEAKNLDPRAFLYDPIIRKIQQSGFPEELDRLYPGTRK